MGTQPRSLCQVIEKKNKAKQNLERTNKNEGKVELALILISSCLSPGPDYNYPHCFVFVPSVPTLTH